MPDGNAGILCLTFDVEQCTNFPRRSCVWDYRKAELDAATLSMTRRLADVALAYGAQAQFFVLGASLENADVASLIAELSAHGHAIGNHTYRHVNLKSPDVSGLQPVYCTSPELLPPHSRVSDVIAWEVRETSRQIARVTGSLPRIFRSPGGFPEGLSDSPDLRAIFQECGFSAVSTQYAFPLEDQPRTQDDFKSIARRNVRDLQPYAYPGDLLELPMMGMSDIHAFRNLDLSVADWQAILMEALDEALSCHLLFAPIMHPHVLSARDPQARVIQALLREARRRQAQIVTLDALTPPGR
ncbi:MAG: polysaccharide deacetylase family protein [Armatimonadetes bacterium]|nr:polysaccharide deacetylase family protein [Armatimonadota bacterium]